MINKEDLKKYQIICTNGKEANECLDMLKELGFDIYKYNSHLKCNCIVYYSNHYKSFMFGNVVFDFSKKINFYQFKKLYKKLIKETKDFEVNNKGQIIKINNYDSLRNVYIFNYINYESYIEDDSVIKSYKKEFLDKCINIGVLFNTKENAEKFIKYIKNYVNE